jgi:hypothetical protein
VMMGEWELNSIYVLLPRVRRFDVRNIACMDTTLSDDMMISIAGKPIEIWRCDDKITYLVMSCRIGLGPYISGRESRSVNELSGS